MTQPPPPGEAARATGTRAARNTAIRAVGEIVGKLASLLLFAVMARKLGEAEVGVFVFAFAFLQIASMPIDLGFDRWMLRQVAADRSSVNALFFNILATKLALSGPVLFVAIGLAAVLGYGGEALVTVIALSAGFVFDAMSRTVWHLFMAVERSSLLAVSVIAQRFSAAALGLAVLFAGYGVVAVALTYTAGAAAGLVVGAVLLTREVGMPERRITPGAWRALAAGSLPFAIADVLTITLFKLDAVLLSLLTNDAAVGRYGAAYRLFESPFFLTFALAGAFAAMYTYLGPDTEPSIRAVFGRSIKFALALLIPCAVAFAVLAEPLTRLFFGDGFAAAAEPLRILAPAIVGLGIVSLSSSLIVSRRDPRTIVRITGAAVALNVVLNFLLIPPYEENGAAAAMLVTEMVFAGYVLWAAARVVDGLYWRRILPSPLLAGAAMAGAMTPLSGSLVWGSIVGLTAYAAVLLLVERVVSPADLEFARSMIRPGPPPSAPA